RVFAVESRRRRGNPPCGARAGNRLRGVQSGRTRFSDGPAQTPRRSSRGRLAPESSAVPGRQLPEESQPRRPRGGDCAREGLHAGANRARLAAGAGRGHRADSRNQAPQVSGRERRRGQRSAHARRDQEARRGGTAGVRCWSTLSGGWHEDGECMMIALVVLLQATPQPPPPPPRRAVPDSGVIATTAQVTPAGVQSVFAARVTGVRFGKRPGEIWVAANWAAYRLDWRDNAMLASIRLQDRAGVQGVAIDPVTGGALVSGVGKTFSFDSSGSPRFSWLLGREMAGGVAVAARPNASGRRVAVVPLPANDSLAVIDADSGTLLKMVPLGVLPVAAVINADGSRAWVTNLGGRKPTAKSRSTKQCCDAFAELVRVDARGIAQPGDVSEIDLVTGTVRAVITTGRHPTGVAWDEKNARLYVANGNSDTVSVIDTRTRTRLRSIAIAPFKERRIGFAPTDVEVSPDGATLYVTLGGLNAVGVYTLPAGQFRGLIPTGWYPSSIDVSADGSTIAVGTLFGVGSGEGRTSGMEGKYVHSYRGSVNVITVPNESELAAYTTSVARNNRLTLGAPEA